MDASLKSEDEFATEPPSNEAEKQRQDGATDGDG